MLPTGFSISTIIYIYPNEITRPAIGRCGDSGKFIKATHLHTCIHVRETRQIFRCRFNNHRSRLKQLCGLYLYHHFSSDGHTLDDISIMPIEEVVLEAIDVISLPSKRLQREEYWYRELCTVCPYGLNDNIEGIGNVCSRTDDGLVVFELLNKQKRKFRNRTAHRKRRKVDSRVTSRY